MNTHLLFMGWLKNPHPFLVITATSSQPTYSHNCCPDTFLPSRMAHHTAVPQLAPVLHGNPCFQAERCKVHASRLILMYFHLISIKEVHCSPEYHARLGFALAMLGDRSFRAPAKYHEMALKSLCAVLTRTLTWLRVNQPV